ncbi:ketose-bisphosphate aldolase [Nakamurella flavida]|uniref:Ketose-bisphosphate aldolase n=1 Tax=Nakamurella flavida TaxID=363630 RepID=A0A939C1C1_9ACTN|nr:ketose-bisphosphate aldolase [Nakamurella flavida]MBM9475305.1 ketose-bisphosphate aldolase [Nakamurella flavida]MDP9776879.1 fructose-bisphosphate aldolase class II [Nakamurella flavida]
MLLNGTDLLGVAHRNDFAVPAFNISDYAMLNGVVRTCEELRSPVILAIHPDELSHIGTDVLPSVLAKAHRASVPITVHLDHGASVEQVLTAIQAGFTSVMIDGSLLPFEENVALTRRVVEIAHAVGVSVEGELGTIGKTDDEAEDGTATIIYTEPADAVSFVERTGVDSLAIAIGTCHGIYPASMKPALRLDLLDEIRAAVDIPLVLHGGSNNPDDEIGRAARSGVNKINISSDIKVAYHDAMREVLTDRGLREPNSIQPRCIAAIQVVAAQKIELFGAAGRADLY